jgi:hypothetical protein
MANRDQDTCLNCACWASVPYAIAPNGLQVGNCWSGDRLDGVFNTSAGTTYATDTCEAFIRKGV